MAMPIEVISNTIGDPARRQVTEAAVRAGIGDRPGDYAVRISGADLYAPWTIQVAGPEGVFDRDFSGQSKHLGFIRYHFDRVIPRRVPASVEPLCDVCVREPGVVAVPMRAAALLGNGHLWEGDGFVCEPHARYWHKFPGYAPLVPGGRGPFRPYCRACEHTMYIEFADGREDLRLRCCVCNRYRFGPLPPG